ncbi:MAG: cytochrome c3 family protein [Candidatus Krumholzibacteriia bacterium]
MTNDCGRSLPNLLGLGCAAVLLAGLCGPARAFHDGGVAGCEACHIMHAERDGVVVMDGGEPVLTAATATDVCLSCHGGQEGVFGHNPLQPPTERGAGNFTFLLEDNLNDAADGLVEPIAGEAAGHSIVSYEFGTAADSRWTHAPGGTYPTSSLGCTSCHDPHGNASFRMLHGVGPVQGGLFEFIYPAPEAEGLECCDGLASESRTSHTAYRAGMAQWCANCHGLYHDEAGTAGFAHPADDPLTGGTIGTYNRYNGTSDPRGGLPPLSYLPEVPFEVPDGTVSRTSGPDGSARLMCLSCHRAHASSAPAAGRWDFDIALLVDDGVVSGSYAIPSPYRAPIQGPLCQKCHGLSIHEHPDLDQRFK